MTISQFNNLSDIAKDEQVFLRGNYLNNYDEGNEMFDVYELDDFYVAFCYDLDKDLNANILAFNSIDELPHVKPLRRL